MELCPKCKKPMEGIDRLAVESQSTIQTIHCSKCDYEGLPIEIEQEESNRE